MSAHYIVSAKVAGELLYAQTHYLLDEAAEDMKSLIAHDSEKVVTVHACWCVDPPSQHKNI